MINQVTITSDDHDPYAPRIRAFVQSSFPNRFVTDKATLVDILTDAIVATKNTRFGPVPSPESLVAMRDVIRQSVEHESPLRFVSPWGSEKPNGTSIDYAELSALHVLECLHERVTKHYSPGIEVRLRVEDVSAPHLFFDRPAEARKEAALYTNGLINLVDILDVPWLKVANEARQVTEEKFNARADCLTPIFKRHLVHNGKQEAISELVDEGWTGGPITGNMIAYYMTTYNKMYPNASLDEKLDRLARYFAATLARKQLGLNGTLPEWGSNFMDISFAEPYPWVRVATHAKRIHYRTVPSFLTNNHIAPWRAKGYLRVHQDGKVTASVASFREPIIYNPYVLTFERAGVKQDVQADYVLA